MSKSKIIDEHPPIEDRLIDRADDAGAQDLATFFAACHHAGALKKLYADPTQRRLSTRDLARDATYATNLREEIKAATKHGLVANLLAKISVLAEVGPIDPRRIPIWLDVISIWNRAHTDGRWRYLPTLCEICGLTIYGRAVGPKGKVSTFCSDQCRELHRGRKQSKRRYLLRKKKRT